MIIIPVRQIQRKAHSFIAGLRFPLRSDGNEAVLDRSAGERFIDRITEDQLGSDEYHLLK